MSRLFPIFGVVLIAMCMSAINAKEHLPRWLESSLKTPVTPMPASIPYVILFEEQLTDLSSTRRRILCREAAKLLTAEARRLFSFIAPRRTGEQFVLRGGWLVRPDGQFTSYDSESLVEEEADSQYQFSMTRLKILRMPEAQVGDVVAWEYIQESAPDTYADSWIFGAGAPTFLSRFGLKVPGNWSIQSLVRNHEGLKPIINESGYTTWELSSLPGEIAELMAPPREDVLPTLMVAGKPDKPGDPRSFDSWQSVGSWYAAIIGAQTRADATLRRTVQESVTAAASKDEAVRAISSVAQGIRYRDVAIGRSRTEPHPAPQILKNGFGDCEDKAVLMITLLREIGVQAYALLARTGDRGAVAEEFPSPIAFNHAIVAVHASSGSGEESPASIDVDGLGHLIVFDPTEPFTEFGDLPTRLQGTRALLSHPTQGRLVELPSLKPDASARLAEYLVTFPEAGGVDVRQTVRYTGQYSASRREYLDSSKGNRRLEEIKRKLMGRFGSALIHSDEIEGVDALEVPLVERTSFGIAFPGKDLGSMRTMATGALIDTRAARLPAGIRFLPLQINASYLEQDHTIIDPPPGWRALEPLPALQIKGIAGEYSLKAMYDGRQLVLDRRLSVTAVTVMPPDYQQAMKFFSEVVRGDNLSLVFERSGP